MHYMELGGAEISLIGLLNALDPAKVDVDLFIHSHQGPLMKFIPRWVNLLPEKKSYSVIEKPIIETIKKGQLQIALARLLAKFRHKRHLKRSFVDSKNDASIFQYVGDSVSKVLPSIMPHVEYDLCISFLTPHNICLNKIKAKKRIAWIHTDYSYIHINVEQEFPIWNAYDYIASISPDVTRSFVNIFPSLKPKIIEIENILSPAFVRARAQEFDISQEIEKSRDRIILLSIGRYSYQKNFDNIPFIAKKLVNLLSNGHSFTPRTNETITNVHHSSVNAGVPDLKWYIIGYGGDEPLIRQKIAEAGMEEHVIILGKKENPYPYIKACDIYVQPSRYEGKSVTVREAQMLCKPVAVTAYSTAPSQINHGVDGIIVPMDNEECARALYEFILDKSLQKSIVNYLHSSDFGNVNEVNKIYCLLEEIK